MKWTPNLALFAAAFCVLHTHARQGSNSESLPIFSYKGARFGSSCLFSTLPSHSASLLCTATNSFTSLPSAHGLGGENPYIDTKDVLNCGRLGRQAAGHPWSALRVVKSCRKTAQRPRCCSKLKQQLCIQNGTRAHYLNCLQEGGRGGEKKRRQSD